MGEAMGDYDAPQPTPTDECDMASCSACVAGGVQTNDTEQPVVNFNEYMAKGLTPASYTGPEMIVEFSHPSQPFTFASIDGQTIRTLYGEFGPTDWTGREDERLASMPTRIDSQQQPKADSAQAAEMLTRSAELLVERGKRYDKADGTSSMDRAVAAFNEITGQNLSEADGWMLMLLLKLSRATAKAGYHADSYEDAAAFVGLMAVARSKREEGK
jgi:hypothetical protein